MAGDGGPLGNGSAAARAAIAAARRLGAAIATGGASLVAEAKVYLIIAGILGVVGVVVVGGLIVTSITVNASDEPVSTCAVSGKPSDVPSELVPLYRDASAKYGLDPLGVPILAAINGIESGFGHNMGPSSAGAIGWMQFMPGTWQGYERAVGMPQDPYSPNDAIPAAAWLLARNGAPADWRQAIFAYNHADWYVDDVLARANGYLGLCTGPSTPIVDVSRGGGIVFPMPRHTPALAAPPDWSPDNGVDVAAPGHTPLLAVGSGTIVRHGLSGFGDWAPVLHLDDGRTVYYGHAGPGNELPVGTHVAAGQVIGEVGAGIVGISTGPHLEIGFCDPTGRLLGPSTAPTMMALLRAAYGS
jgi:hypothetical protein